MEKQIQRALPQILYSALGFSAYKKNWKEQFLQIDERKDSENRMALSSWNSLLRGELYTVCRIVPDFLNFSEFLLLKLCKKLIPSKCDQKE